jgi:hypothetical protein
MRRPTILAWSLALVIALGSGLAALAGNQPLCCTGNSEGGTITLLHNGSVSTQWQQGLSCLPLCGTRPTPCSFCMQAALYVWTWNGWVFAPPSSTGLGPVNSTGYQVACGQDPTEQWNLAWGSYAAGSYRVVFTLANCNRPCQYCGSPMWTGQIPFSIN